MRVALHRGPGRAALPLLRLALAALGLWAAGACTPTRPLSEAHHGLPCQRCHSGQLRESPERGRCLACHEPIAKRAQAKKGIHGDGEALQQPCGRCHVEHRGKDLKGWRSGEEEFRKDHARVTGFALQGPHEKPRCEACHRQKIGGRTSYSGASPACSSCHGLPHGPVSEALRDCARCHEATSFHPPRKEPRFDHDRDTAFPLTGNHQVVGCLGGCHRGKPPTFHLGAERAGDCAGCHKDKSPHGGGYGATPCRTCHDAARRWASVLPFDHAARTAFTLQKPHNKPCLACHRPELKSLPSPDCGGCHQKKDKHKGRFAAAGPCSTCHAPPSWKVSALDHGQRAGFVLTANHAAPTMDRCRTCHRGRGPANFEDLSALKGGGPKQKGYQVDCLGCHRHEKAHGGQFRSAQCLDCHELPGKEKLRSCLDRHGAVDKNCLKRLTWIGHGPQNPFKLIGGHDLIKIAAKCRACHRDADEPFQKIPSACASCHGGADRHKGSLGKDCARCHDPRAGTWRNTSAFDHASGAFPLLGAHQRTPCQRCHPGADVAVRFKPRPKLCGDAECHQKDDAHERKNGLSCGQSGCHDPRDGGWTKQKR